MALTEKIIEFTLLDGEQTVTVQCYVHEYRNLMVLLKDKVFPDDFGECGGMGRCGTCLVKVSGDSDDLDNFYKNEQTTLLKMGVSEPGVRLSCQIQIDEHLQNAVVQLVPNI